MYYMKTLINLTVSNVIEHLQQQQQHLFNHNFYLLQTKVTFTTIQKCKKI